MASTAIVWFRHDLRLDDNPAWAAATAKHDRVVPVVVVDDRVLAASGSFRRDLWWGHVRALPWRGEFFDFDSDVQCGTTWGTLG